MSSRRTLVEAPQRSAVFGNETDGTYHWNHSQGNSGSVVVSGATATFPGELPNTMIANTPWDGFADVGGGYGMLADEGIYMWVPKIGADLVVGVKE